jgi:PEGA domain-containing protein
MLKTTITFLAFAGMMAAQVTVPDGTRLRVRLDQSISSANADQGQSVELSVTEAVKIGDQVVIPEGARVTGTITEAQEKRHMGRAGKLDFSIDRVRVIDGEWIPLRYTVNKRSGGSHAVSTGVLTAGAAVLFWPAAPAFLLIKGKDVTLNKGMVFDTFTDQDHVLTAAQTPAGPAGNRPSLGMTMAGATGSGSITIVSDKPGADIEVDGAFVGNTPTTIPIQSGMHQVSVRNGSQFWQRNLQVTAGSTVTLNAQLGQTQFASRLSK